MCRSVAEASHLASVQSSLHDGHQFRADRVDWVDRADPNVPSNLEAMGNCPSVAETYTDAMPSTFPAEEGPPHVTLNSTELLYNSACPNPMPPSPPREARLFQYYDHDFMCSPDPANYAVSNQEMLADDIAEDSPSPPSQRHSQRTGASFSPARQASSKSRFFDPKPQSTFGPAKTIRPSLHQVHPTQTGGVKRFQNQRQSHLPPTQPRVCITQRHRPTSSSGRSGTKRMRSSGAETKSRSILDFMPRR